MPPTPWLVSASSSYPARISVMVEPRHAEVPIRSLIPFHCGMNAADTLACLSLLVVPGQDLGDGRTASRRGADTQPDSIPLWNECRRHLGLSQPPRRTRPGSR